MPKVIGGVMALAALGASTLVGAPPFDCLLRGFVAYLVGIFATQLWYVFFTIQIKYASSTGGDTSSHEEMQAEAGSTGS